MGRDQPTEPTEPTEVSSLEADGRDDSESVGLALTEGAMVRRFRLQRRLGAGNQGEVWEARDTELGRVVALKIMRIGRQPLAEAKALAKLEHPFVQVHDLFDEGLHRFIVMAYIKGEPLSRRLLGGPLPRTEALRIAEQLASALVALGKLDLVHCDLKPANVLIDESGRPKLVDFGMVATPHAKARGGTWAYMAPEQRLGHTVTAATDVWALGVMLHQMLTGRLPGEPCRTDASMPGTLAALIAECRRYDREMRPTPAQLVQALRAALAPAAAPQPFRGMAAFDAATAQQFFGREADVDHVVERLRRTGAALVVGPSGVGKSSLVAAGVLPRMQEAHACDVIQVRPGRRPIAAAANAVEPQAPREVREQLAQQLRRTPGRIEAVLDDRARERGAHQVLYVDQFEELFTLAEPSERAAFIDLLQALAQGPARPLRVIASLRSDHFGALVHYPALLALFGTPVPITAPDLAALEAAMTEPVRLVNHTFDAPELLRPLLNDLAHRPAAYPLLQFCGEWLWTERNQTTRTLPLSRLRDAGGIGTVLPQRAEALLASLSADQIARCRQMLTTLVNADGTRRPALAQRLCPTPADTTVLEQLLKGRLLTSVDDDAGRWVELVHETLASNWPRLQRWLDADREGQALLHQLEGQAADWRAEGSHRLLPLSRAEYVRAELNTAGRTETPEISAFLDASVRAGINERRQRWVLVLVSVLALIVFGGLLYHQQAERALEVGNVGRFKLEITAVDFDPIHARPKPAPGVHPTWMLFELPETWPALDAPLEPLPTTVDGPWVEAGGEALLVVGDRGRPGERCERSMMRVRLPGYQSRAQANTVHITVPSCRASQAGTVPVPEGPFYAYGPGEPPQDAEPFETLAERVETLTAYRIDQYEVSNSSFSVFTQIAHHTGIEPRSYEKTPAGQRRAQAHFPVVLINAIEARTYCRWAGKDLPTDLQWLKAGRGGELLSSGPNPRPRRNFPSAKPVPSVTMESIRPDHPDRGPYGAINMASNAFEWTLTRYLETETSLVLRGGQRMDTPDLKFQSLAYRNRRRPEVGFLDSGIRCVSGWSWLP